ncbi:DUF2782 domain-containing protein [Halomonas sp. I1]|uniref:DUF2782 domain-containing protein n=1 Tax=Halomonas sp. I1 TaxID=393536 RepID=UPI0028DF2A79|nr:DUF2782 domain-containing protein [Halomonas sp. I1]MDT8895536.1 DUF2782 domain-containing protein [Halomonas sp. I1]
MLTLFRPFAALLVGGSLMLAGLPALAQSGGSPDPEITTRQEADRTVREYRVNGDLYAIEVRPSSGPSYYLIDRNGDGNFERQAGDDISIPEWVRRDS